MDSEAVREKPKKKRKGRIIFLSILLVLVLIVGAFFLYLSIYSKADETCDKALEPDGGVTVQKEKDGYFFDGKSTTDLILFYPGAKVETKAYAPLLRRIASESADVYLFDMPFHMAFFGLDKADKIRDSKEYAHYYMAGHSLGAAMAGVYVADHLDEYDGLIFLAGYPTKDLHRDGFALLSVYGTNDMDVESLRKNPQYRPDDYTETVIEGGNHANFGNYGVQKGDGTATITREEQQKKTAEAVSSFISARE